MGTHPSPNPAGSSSNQGALVRPFVAVVGVLGIASGAYQFADAPGAVIGAVVGLILGVIYVYRDGWFSSPEWTEALIVICLGILGGILGHIVQDELFASDSRARSIEQIISDAADERLDPVDMPGTSGPLRVQLRPEGDASLVFVFRPTDPDSRRSDELQIWDPVKDGYERRLRYRPRPDPALSNAASILGLGQLKATGPERLQIALHTGARNLDGRPGDDMILDLRESVFGQLIWPHPVLLSWSGKTNGYRLTPLLSPDSVGNTTPARVISHRYYRGKGDVAGNVLIPYIYGIATDVSDDRNSQPLPKSYPVELYRCHRETVPTSRGPQQAGIVLTAGYVVREKSIAFPEILQPVIWHIDLSRDPIKATTSVDTHEVIHVGRNVDRLDDLLKQHTPGGSPCFKK